MTRKKWLLPVCIAAALAIAVGIWFTARFFLRRREVWVAVPQSACVTITNAEGETMNFDPLTGPSGSIEVLQIEGSIKYTFFRVLYSESFTFTSDAEDVFFSVVWGDFDKGQFCNMSGTNIDSAVISKTAVSASGTDMEYRLRYRTAPSSPRKYSVSGTGAGSVTMELTENSAAVTSSSPYHFELVDYHTDVIYASHDSTDGARFEIRDTGAETVETQTEGETQE